MEKLMFPMKNINITQKEGGTYSHKGIMAIDIAGKDTGIESAIAPCALKVVVVSGTKVIIESLNKVEFADGSIDYANMEMYHDNNTSDLYIGKTFAQGQVFYQEGTAGNATGNHIHLVVAKGKFAGEVKASTGNWTLRNEVHTTKAFFIDDSYKIYNTQGNKYKSAKPTQTVENVWSFEDKYGNTRYIRSIEHTFKNYEQTSSVTNKKKYFKVALNPKAKFFETKDLKNPSKQPNFASGDVIAKHSHQVTYVNGKGWKVL